VRDLGDDEAFPCEDTAYRQWHDALQAAVEDQIDQ
jgi:hypothetical protein